MGGLKQFRPSFWFPGAHFQTIWASKIRNIKSPKTNKEKIELDDGDFLILFWMINGNRPIIIIVHGLEGDESSNNVKSMFCAIKKIGWNGVLILNRNCGGISNRLHRTYHAGETGDLDFVVHLAKKRYPNAPLMIYGYSLGGNILLKWLGEKGEKACITSAAAVSTPFDLASSANTLNKGFSKIYQRHFLKLLRKSAKRKFMSLPPLFNHGNLHNIKTLREFDERVTAPLHGFKNAAQYYSESSCKKLLKDVSGSVCIMDIYNGDIITMASSPSYDPNVFVHGVDKKTWKSLLDHRDKPLINKAIAGLYPPGSTIKTLVALSALENDIVNPKLIVKCSGKIELHGQTYHCWKEKGHGFMNLRSAIKQSCDVYFYEVARRLGVDRLSITAKEFGLGKKIFHNLNEEKAISEFENILLMDQIEGGNFINKDKAADIFKNEFDEDIVDILGENPLPFSAVYTISELARDYESIQNIISNIETLESVDVVLYEKDAIIKFDKLVRNIMIFIFAISFFIILVVIFFVSNTILLVIYSKKEDIQTYGLLGATTSFIKLPYLLEGMIHGLIGSVISILLLMLLYNLLQYFLSSLLGIMNYDIISIVLLNVLLGMFLGFLGSSKALSSYIRD